jgi:hypothetical protein
VLDGTRRRNKSRFCAILGNRCEGINAQSVRNEYIPDAHAAKVPRITTLAGGSGKYHAANTTATSGTNNSASRTFAADHLNPVKRRTTA